MSATVRWVRALAPAALAGTVSCTQVLGLDEPSVRDEAAGGGAATTTGPGVGATTQATSSTGEGASGPGGNDTGGAASGNGGGVPCDAPVDDPGDCRDV